MQVHTSASTFIPTSPVQGKTDPERPDRPGVSQNRPPGHLDPQQLQELVRLRQRDREVRAHEMAHLAAAGPYATGGPTFEYQKGPDGQRYAVGGHVNIDTSPVPGDPEATLRKAEAIRRAALAPGDPSPQDRSVAAAAAAMALKAQAELQQLQQKRAEQRRPEEAVNQYHRSGEDPQITVGGKLDLQI